MAIKSVFFDLDGTLWDNRACSFYVVQVAAARLEELSDSHELPEDYFNMLNVALLDSIIESGLRSLSQSSYSNRFIKLFERCGIPDLKLARELGSHCHNAKRLAVRAFLKKDACQTIMRMRNRGIKVGILTNGTPAVKRNIIKLLGLQDIVDHIVLGEAEGLVKPDARLFVHCIKLAGARPDETLFVGDSFFTDLLGAKRANAKAMLLCDKKVKIPARVPPPDFALTNLSAIMKVV